MMTDIFGLATPLPPAKSAAPEMAGSGRRTSPKSLRQRAGDAASRALAQPPLLPRQRPSAGAVAGAEGANEDAMNLFKTVRPNIVQSIRAFRVPELAVAAADLGQHFLYANCAHCASKAEVLETIATAFLFPKHFGKNFDALADCLTDMIYKAGQQPGFVIVLEACRWRRSSTRKHARSCSTCSATRPNSGRAQGPVPRLLFLRLIFA